MEGVVFAITAYRRANAPNANLSGGKLPLVSNPIRATSPDRSIIPERIELPPILNIQRLQSDELSPSEEEEETTELTLAREPGQGSVGAEENKEGSGFGDLVKVSLQFLMEIEK